METIKTPNYLAQSMTCVSKDNQIFKTPYISNIAK